MTKSRSGDSCSDNPEGHRETIAGRCRRCTQDLLPPGEDMQTVSSYDLACSGEILRHYPYQPWWWREQGTDDLRRDAYERFDVTEISTLTDEIRSRSADVDASDVTNIESLIRCLLSLSWRIEVGRG